MKNVVPLLVSADLHDLDELKKACVDLIKTDPLTVTMSKQFAKLSSSHPDLWKETRAALGLPKQDDDDVDGDNASVQQKQPTGEDIFQALFGCSSFGARR